MCRVFGFRSVIPSQVHKSLIQDENALMNQSMDHPDGWGVSYYINEIPHVIKSVDTALNDKIFHKVSGVATSQTVIAHIRKATQGEHSLINTHPFQFGRWVFAHNGHIPQFSDKKELLLAHCDQNLKRYVLGSTDSEVLFYFLLCLMSKKKDLHASWSAPELIGVLQDALKKIQKLLGDHSLEDSSDLDRMYLTFLLTDGQAMAAYQGGKDLHYSTYKSRCSERASCTFFKDYCEAPSKDGKINHLLFSSEPLQGENIWMPMQPGDLKVISKEMELKEKNVLTK